METTTVEKSTEAVSLLNDLIVINNDRIEGYEKAAKETEDAELKSVFNSMVEESRKFKSELVTEVTNLGEKPAEGTKTSGKFYRAWMDIKSALAGKDRKTILSSCEFGEDAALEEYESVLKSDKLPAQYRTIISRQESALRQSHDKIKSMRDRAQKI